MFPVHADKLTVDSAGVDVESGRTARVASAAKIQLHRRTPIPNGTADQWTLPAMLLASA